MSRDSVHNELFSSGMISCKLSIFGNSDLSVKPKIKKHREKVLRCDSLLQRNPFVQEVPSSRQKKSKKAGKEVQTEKDYVQGRPKKDGASDSGMVDIWNDKGCGRLFTGRERCNVIEGAGKTYWLGTH